MFEIMLLIIILFYYLCIGVGKTAGSIDSPRCH